MPKKLRSAPDGASVLEIETSSGRLRRYLLPAGMSTAARLAFLSSPRLAPIEAHMEECGRGEDGEGAVIFALHKLAMDLMARFPAADGGDASPPALAPLPLPVARVVIRQCSPSVFVYCTHYLDEFVCREERLDSVDEALSAALALLPPEAGAVELSYEGIVSGTYPRPILDRDPVRAASDAVRTKAAIDEVCGREPPPRRGGGPMSMF
ncbi:hypothetical protein [Caldimonas tepidiphila]|uniref:hypothetical protein n=1 Tax=Caldimonas tepidiphila TaxID=2315841 RepID=UPI000E5AE293|nr:hypothetical protein [Caldimonas tepidiphila]